MIVRGIHTLGVTGILTTIAPPSFPKEDKRGYFSDPSTSAVGAFTLIYPVMAMGTCKVLQVAEEVGGWVDRRVWKLNCAFYHHPEERQKQRRRGSGRLE